MSIKYIYLRVIQLYCLIYILSRRMKSNQMRENHWFTATPCLDTLIRCSMAINSFVLLYLSLLDIAGLMISLGGSWGSSLICGTGGGFLDCLVALACALLALDDILFWLLSVVYFFGYINIIIIVCTHRILVISRYIDDQDVS